MADLDSPPSPIPLALELPGAPLRMRVHETGDEFISPCIRATGLWEPAETRFFVTTIRPGDFVVDVGANIGYYSLIASRLVGDAGRVLAIEPDADNCAILRHNVAGNGATNVRVVEAAASDINGVERLYRAGTNLGDHRTYDSGDGRPSKSVPAFTLDHLVGDQAQRVDFIKIDAQGAEAKILAGMAGTLRRNAGHITIVLEFWPFGLERAGSSAARVLELLDEYRFEMATIDEDAGKLRPTTPEALLELARGPLHPSTGFFANLVLARGLRAGALPT